MLKPDFKEIWQRIPKKKNEGAAPFPDNEKTNRYLRVRWLLYFRKQGRKAKHD
jgi:hypothetical protein